MAGDAKRRPFTAAELHGLVGKFLSFRDDPTKWGGWTAKIVEVDPGSAKEVRVLPKPPGYMAGAAPFWVSQENLMTRRNVLMDGNPWGVGI